MGENACTSENANTTTSPGTTENVQPLNRALWSVALVAILACLFSTLDGVTTLSDAQRLHRGRRMAAPLFGGKRPCSGHRIRHSRTPLYGIRHVRRYAAVDYFHSGRRGWRKPVIGLIVFFFSSGFFVTFFTTMFLQLAPRMRTPAAVGGHGSRCEQRVRVHHFRAPRSHLTQAGVVAVMIASIVLFMLASTAFIGAGLFRLPPTAREREVTSRPRRRKRAFRRRAAGGIHRPIRPHTTRDRRAARRGLRRAPSQTNCR